MRVKPLGTVIYGLLHRTRVSPMPRAGRTATTLLAASLLVVMGLLAAFAPVGAQGNETATGGGATPGGDAGGNGTAGEGGGDQGGAPAEGAIERVLTIGVIDTGCPDGADPCWDTNLLVGRPGERIVLVADLRNSDVMHNLHVSAPVNQQTPSSTNELHRVTFTFPEEIPATGLEYVCDVHPTTMVGVLATPAMAATLASAGHGEEVPEMGVHFLAYWVGVIAFAVLFVVYGITFFLFKYNETSATTDHWDRSGAAGEGKRVRGGVAGLLAVVIAVAAMGAIIYLARFR